MVVGLIGSENAQGEFEVDQVFYPHVEEPQPPVASPSSNDDQFVMFVSGLNVGASYEYQGKYIFIINFKFIPFKSSLNVMQKSEDKYFLVQ